MNIYFVIIGLFTLVGYFVNSKLKSKFDKYGSMPNRTGLTGEQVALSMLDEYGLHDVKVEVGSGMLTDHYNPATKIITLSDGVFNGRSLASTAVASHECGHAVQHAAGYSMLQVRSNLVPIVQVSARIQQFMFFGTLFSAGSGIGGNFLLYALVITFGITALFSLVTLPVEFDASNRALKWMDSSGVAIHEEYDGAKDALKWAAMTYIAQALGAFVMFIYFLSSALKK
jgi:uncharacterized protein